MTEMVEIETQIEARKRLVWEAQRAKNLGFSRLEFEENPQAIEFCKKNGLKPEILSHVAWYIWKGLR